MHSLHHHDGIIHHDGDRQQQGGEYKQVDGEAHHIEEEERTDQRHRYGNQRDERRTYILQEDIHHEEHQCQRHEEGEHHLLNRGIEELRHVVVDLILHAGRHQFLLIFKFGLYLLGNLVGIRTGHLLNHGHDRRHAIVLHRYRVALTAKFNLGDVLQLQRLTFRVTLDNNIAKLLSSSETACITHGILVSHSALLTKLTWCSLDVLFSQSCCNISRNQVVLLHHIRPQPDTHGVGLRAES